MSDPTPTPTTPAVTARSARETLREAADSIESLNASPYLTDARMEALRCAKALRALLDAPTGAVERLCEAAENVRVVHEKHDDDGPCLCVPECRGCALRSALAAVRASPEAVGAGASGRAAEAINTAGRIVREAEAERDAARAQRDEAIRGETRAIVERDALKAELENAQREITILRADRDRAAMPRTANGNALPCSQVICAYCGYIGLPPHECIAPRSAPPPVPEAPKFTNSGTGLKLYETPISERARWIADAAWMCCASSLSRDEPYELAKYVDKAVRCLAAAERAVQNPNTA